MIKLWKRFDQWTKRLQERLDVKKKLPEGYVNKWVFRGAVIATLLFFGLIIHLEGLDNLTGSVSLSCPEESLGYCVNTFAVCNNDPMRASLEYGIICPTTHDNCLEYRDLCESEILLPGETVGHVPHPIAQKGSFIMIMLLLAAFPINHLLWRIKQTK